MQKIDRFLLVDDDDITNFLHKSLIEQMAVAHEVLCLGSAEEALGYFVHSSRNSRRTINQREIILLDINMPVMDGFEFIDAFRALHLAPHIKIFIVSSSTNNADLRKAQALGISGYVSKPLTEQKIRSLIATADEKSLQECLC